MTQDPSQNDEPKDLDYWISQAVRTGDIDSLARRILGEDPLPDEQEPEDGQAVY